MSITHWSKVKDAGRRGVQTLVIGLVWIGLYKKRGWLPLHKSFLFNVIVMKRKSQCINRNERESKYGEAEQNPVHKIKARKTSAFFNQSKLNGELIKIIIIFEFTLQILCFLFIFLIFLSFEAHFTLHFRSVQSSYVGGGRGWCFWLWFYSLL